MNRTSILKRKAKPFSGEATSVPAITPCRCPSTTCPTFKTYKVKNESTHLRYHVKKRERERERDMRILKEQTY